MAGRNEEIARSFSHDVRAPLNNLKGLVGELHDAMDQLHGLIRDHETDLPPAFVARVHEIVEKEFDPLMHYVAVSSDQVTERVASAVEQLRRG